MASISAESSGSGFRTHVLTALIGAALFSIESWGLGPLSWIYGYGGGLHSIPTYLGLSFGDRNFSWWAPFAGGGLPRLSFMGEADPLSIEQVLFTYLPIWLAYGLHRYLQYVVAIYFAARVCQEQLGLNTAWSSLAGLFHASFAYLITGTLFTIAGVPLLAWLLVRTADPRRGVLAAILAGLGFSLCTTFTFSVPYLLVFGFVWLFFVQQHYTWHAVRQFAVFALVLIVAECPQLFAVMASAPTSHRAGWPAEKCEFSLDGLFYRQLQFDMFAQDEYLALITLNLPGLAFFAGVALFGVAYWRRPDLRPFCGRGGRAFIFYGLLSQKWLWLGVQKSISKVFPWAMGIYMGRFYQVPAAFLIGCILTLVCFLAWQLVKARSFRFVGAGAVFALIAFMLVWPKYVLIYPLGIHDWGEKNFQVAALDELRKNEGEPFRVASVLPLQPCYAWGQGVECADGVANLFPARYRELWLQVINPVLTKLPTAKNIFDPEHGKPQDNYIFLGADLIAPSIGLLPGEDVMTCLRDGFDVEARFNLNLLRLLNVKYLLSEYPLRGPGLRLAHAPSSPPTTPQMRCHATGLVHGHHLGGTHEIGLADRARRAILDFAEASGARTPAKIFSSTSLSALCPAFALRRTSSLKVQARTCSVD